MNKDFYYQQLYDVLENVILESLEPKTIFSLSGGLDTRCFAGILAENEIDIPAFTYPPPNEPTASFEPIIAHKVAKALGIEHFLCDSAEKVPAILRDKGFRHILSAKFFNEINGCWSGYWARNHLEFLRAQHKAMTDRLEETSQSVKPYEPLKFCFPIINPRTLAAMDKIPWQYRITRQIQRWILKNKFPQLWHIIYHDSFLPASLPYSFHMVGVALKQGPIYASKVAARIVYRHKFLGDYR